MKLLRLFSSLKLTAFLIFLLGMLFLAGLWIPQKKLLKQDMYEQWRQGTPAVVAVLESLKLTEVYDAPLTLAVWGLFFINLTTVMVRRVDAIGKRIALPADDAPIPELSRFTYRRMVRLRRDGFDEFFRELHNQGFKIVRSKEGFLAIKNRYAPMANIIFHLSFFLILIGALISTYTKFAGMVNLSVGESFSGGLQEYAAPPYLPKFGSPPSLSFTLLEITPEIKGNTSTALRVVIRDEKGVRQELGINRPYKKGAIYCVLKNLGIGPLMVLVDSQREIDGAYVKLNVLKGKEDHFEIGPYRVVAKFFPDYQIVAGVEQSKSDEFLNPALHLKAYLGEQFVAERTLKLGEALPLGRAQLEFRDLSFWVSISVVEEYGLAILYSGFMLALVALVWRFVAYRRELFAKFMPTDDHVCLDLAGRAEFYRALTDDEFDAMLRNMKSVELLELK